ncbi:hypothetical protein [Deinococcus maricopensis]|uniref:hypothetical protein n=1 Tax=Deinococcus maricopensis TaxID=309887 RepID=UPI0011D2A533|nr:hypothetical protein [Deinococcus maricopensis]
MKKILILSLCLSATASANSLTAHLPAGALATFETRHLGGALQRFEGLVGGVAEHFGGNARDAAELLSMFTPAVEGSIGDEGVLGVFAVGNGRGIFEPHLLAVSKLNADARALLPKLSTRNGKATIGKYTFVRQDDLFIGMTSTLVYASTNKTLLMNYLSRLNGKAAPTLAAAPAYATPTTQVGAQELRLFVNFSGIAKVARSALQAVMLPRLLSPIVDAVDTLGQVAAGVSTTSTGLSAVSAHVVNPDGRDTPLRQILTHTTPGFDVPRVIPADAEAVSVRACDPLTAQYTAHWLTRLDLFDPTGLLTDTQLAHHLERQSSYLADECAQVTLAGAGRASLTDTNPLGSLAYMVSYQKVRDEAAARAHMAEFAPLVNTTIRQAVQSGRQALNDAQARLKALGTEQAASLSELTSLLDDAKLGDVEYVYDFRDGYLVSALNRRALDAALRAPRALADEPAFRALNLTGAGAGFVYQPAPATPYAPADIRRALEKELAASPAAAFMEDDAQGLTAPMSSALADLLNRYGGSSTHTTVDGTVVLSKTNITYRW